VIQTLIFDGFDKPLHTGHRRNKRHFPFGDSHHANVKAKQKCPLLCRCYVHYIYLHAEDGPIPRTIHKVLSSFYPPSANVQNILVRIWFINATANDIIE
jgi:hypothetical protein